jgi:hypothetical protein
MSNEPLQPGKRYGITALVCALLPGIFLCFVLFVVPHLLPDGHAKGESMEFFFALSMFFSIPCVILGIFYGILGCKTEGWRYAYAGLGLSLLYVLYILCVILQLCFYGT